MKVDQNNQHMKNVSTSQQPIQARFEGFCAADPTGQYGCKAFTKNEQKERLRTHGVGHEVVSVAGSSVCQLIMVPVHDGGVTRAAPQERLKQQQRAYTV